MSTHKSLVLDEVRKYHQESQPSGGFVPGVTEIWPSGAVLEEEDRVALVEAALELRIAAGHSARKFESRFARRLQRRKAHLTNSGSSANLLATTALTSHLLEDRRLRPGDEVITVAAGFPTTVNPILQNGLVPVFVDVDLATCNTTADRVAQAIGPKTRAIIIAHALGNPFDLSAALAFCKKHDLWLIEDNCDALGCSYTLNAAHPLAASFADQLKLGEGVSRYTGTWGDLSTQSFYPPHHLTMGEGGAVNVVRDMKLKVYAESFRDWGRDCWCASGVDNTCNKRFGWQLGELPQGYDHKYIYSHLGYNLKPLDPQAAIGRQQLKKLPAFIEARKANWNALRAGLADLEEFFSFSLPTHATGWTPDGYTWDTSGNRTECSWFGFLLLVRPEAPFRNVELGKLLDEAKIGNRMLFGGNLVRQPAFVQLRKDDPKAFRVIGDLAGADRIMNQSLFLGVYPGLTKPMLDYMIETIHRIVKKARG